MAVCGHDCESDSKMQYDRPFDNNIDEHRCTVDIFHEQHRSAVTKMIDDISNLEQGEKKKENEGYDKSEKKKCIIS